MKKAVSLPALILIMLFCFQVLAQPRQKPNIVYVIVDQWRAQSTGYGGNKEVLTPHIDRIAEQSINLKNAVSGMPVCTPHRASLLSGQYPTTNGVFMNDVMLDTSLTTIAKVYKANGYDTGFIGKWHIDGHGRNNYIPKNRQQGFEYWKALECTHNYNKSPYYAGDSNKMLFWKGYDALAQSEDAVAYIKNNAGKGKPFMLFISLGPPHDPYQTAPAQYQALYANRNLTIDKNVPAGLHQKIQADLKGYYAHMSAIDEGIGKIWQSIQESGKAENTIFIFTSDHGDLMGAHGQRNKQQPYNESIKVPFLISYPAGFGNKAKTLPTLLNSPDIMPTLLGLTGLRIPKSVEGKDFSGVLIGSEKDNVQATLISCMQPFGQWNKTIGGKEYRGVYTGQYTYVRDLNGPWLLFDNIKDPYQLNNLVSSTNYQRTRKTLDKSLTKLLKKRKDDFRPGMEYVKKYNYVVDETETVPYIKVNYEGIPISELK